MRGAAGGAGGRFRGGGLTRLAAFVAVVIVPLLVFAPLRHAEFLMLDDSVYVVKNELTSRGLTWEGFVWAWTDASLNWHPLTWLSHMLDCQLFGLDPGVHHLVNVALHVANGALLLHALLRMTGHLWPSVFVALLFAVHPLRVESVAWVAERKDVLSTFFWFVALLAYVRFTERRTPPRYAAVCAALTLSLLSKGMAVTFPVWLLLLDYWPLRRWPRERLWALVREKLPLFAIAAAGAVAAVAAQRRMGALVSLAEQPMSARLANALVSAAAYLVDMCWPVGLALPYPLGAELPSAWRIGGAVVGLSAISGFVALEGRRRRYLVTGWLWYLVTLSPVIGIVAIGHQSRADRYTYVPLVGVFVAIAWGARAAVRRWPAWRAAACGAGILAVGCCAVLTRRQLEYWHDGIALFGHTLAVTEDNTLGEVSYGAALVAAGRVEEGLAHYQRALRITPHYADAQVEAGRLLLQLGRPGEAEPHLREALRLNPANANALSNLGALVLAAGRMEEAERYLRDAVRLKPSLFSARVNLGAVMLARGDAAGARDQFEAATRRRPDSAQAQLGLAQALEREGREAESRAAYARAMQLDAEQGAAAAPLPSGAP